MPRLLTCCALLCCAGLLTLDSLRADDRTELFDALDANGDGTVTADEVPEAQKKAFDRLLRKGDENEDGKVTKAEFLGATDKKPEPKPLANGPQQGPSNEQMKAFFDRADQDGDGKLTLDELPEQARDRLKPFFERTGKDAITLEELTRLRQMGGQRPNAQRPEGGRPGMAGRFGDPGQMFDRMDTDGDGMLTLDEAPDRAKPFVRMMLTRLNKGEDGSITKEEAMKLAERAREARGGDRPEMRRPDAKGDAPRGEGEMRRDRPEGRDRPGFAGPMRGRGPKFLTELDTDEDGMLSKAELENAAKLVDALDTDGDGKLNGRELFGMPPGFEGRPGPGGRPEMRNRPRPEGDAKRPERRRPEAE